LALAVILYRHFRRAYGIVYRLAISRALPMHLSAGQPAALRELPGKCVLQHVQQEIARNVQSSRTARLYLSGCRHRAIDPDADPRTAEARPATFAGNGRLDHTADHRAVQP